MDIGSCHCPHFQKKSPLALHFCITDSRFKPQDGHVCLAKASFSCTLAARGAGKQIFGFLNFCSGKWALPSNKTYTVRIFPGVGWALKNGKCLLQCPINTSNLTYPNQSVFHSTFTPPTPCSNWACQLVFLFSQWYHSSDISWAIFCI